MCMRRSLKIECLVWMDNVTTFPLNVAALFNDSVFLCVDVRMLESSKNYTRSTTITQNMIDIFIFESMKRRKILFHIEQVSNTRNECYHLDRISLFTSMWRPSLTQILKFIFIFWFRWWAANNTSVYKHKTT